MTATANLSVGIKTDKAKSDLTELLGWMKKEMDGSALKHIQVGFDAQKLAEALKSATGGASVNVNVTQAVNEVNQLKQALHTTVAELTRTLGDFADRFAVKSKGVRRVIVDDFGNAIEVAGKAGEKAGEAFSQGLKKTGGNGSLAKQEAAEFASWSALSKKQQLGLALRNARASEAGADASLLPGLAGSQLASNLAQTVGSVKDLEAALDSLTASVKDNEQQQDSLFSTLQGVVGKLGSMGLDYGKAAIQKSAENGIEFDYQTRSIAAHGDNRSPDAYKAVQEGLFSIKDAPFNVNELAVALRDLQKSGVDAANGINLLPTVISASTFGETDMKAATEDLVGVLETFNLQSQKSATLSSNFKKVGDVVTWLAQETKSDFHDVAKSLQGVTDVAQEYGVEIENVAAAISMLGKEGVGGEKPGASAKSMFESMYAPSSEKAGRAFKELDFSMHDKSTGQLKDNLQGIVELVEKLQKYKPKSQEKLIDSMFSADGAKQFRAIFNDFDEFKRRVEDSKSQTGLLSRQAEELSKSTQYQLKQLKADYDNLFTAAWNDNDFLAAPIKALREVLNDPATVEALKAIVSEVVQLGAWVVQHAEDFVTLGKIIASLAVAQGAASAFTLLSGTATSLVGAVAPLAAPVLAAGGAMAPAATGAVGLRAALSALPGVLLAVSPPVAVVVGAIAAAGTAFFLFRDRTAEAMRDVANDVTRMAGSVVSNLNEVIRKAGALSTASIEGAVESASSNIAILKEKAKKSLEELGKYEIKNEADARAAVAATTTDDNAGGVYTKDDDKKYKAANAYLDMLPAIKEAETRYEVAKAVLLARQEQDEAKRKEDEKRRLKEWEDFLKKTRGESNSSSKRNKTGDIPDDFSDKLNAITKKQDSGISAEKDAYARYKEILDLRVKYGEISQGAENKLLEERQQKLDSVTEALRNQAIVELENLQTSKGVAEAQKKDIKNRIEQIKETRNLEKAKRDHNLVAGKEEDRLTKKHLGTKLEDDISGFEKKEVLSREDSQKKFDSRFASQEDIAATEAYNAVKERGKTLSDEYKKAIKEEEKTLADLTAEYSKAGVPTEGQDQALAEQRQRVDDATEAYERLTAAIYRQAAAASKQAKDQAVQSKSFGEGWDKAYAKYREESSDSSKIGEQMFTKSTEAMTNALVTFANTGKFEWKSLANTIIQALLQIYAQQMALKLAGMLAGMFSPATAPAAAGAAGAANTPRGYSAGDLGTGLRLAKGGAFTSAGELTAFAKGGTFTNSIVSKPTYFQFANGGSFGLGMMGEAGDEAIMPLARDSQGRLGVRYEPPERGSQNQNMSQNTPVQPNNIRIINAFDTSEISDYIGSDEGERVVMNVVKRNQSAIKRLANG